jgi:hypothetical protein
MAQRSLYVMTMVYYRLYAKLCYGSTQYHSIAKVSWSSRGTMAPLKPCELGWVTMPISHIYEQGTLPTASLISKQAIPYQTRGGTCCLGVSTPMIPSLADSSMTNHILRRNPTISTIPALLKLQHRSSPRSNHNSTDGRPSLTKTQAKLNITKDGKTCTTLMTVCLSITNQV